MAQQLLSRALTDVPRRSRALAGLLAFSNDARHLEFHSLDSDDLPNLERMQNLEAAVGFAAGQLVEPPCTDCVAGYGQFAGCVRVEGFLHGSCTNYHYGGEGTRCSLRGKFSSLPCFGYCTNIDGIGVPALGALPSLPPPVASSSAPVPGSPTGRSGKYPPP